MWASTPRGEQAWRLGLAVLVLACGLVYAGALDAPFIFDDYDAILDNPRVRQLWPITVPLTPPEETALAGRPIASLSLAFNHALSGQDPWGYRLTNVAIHAANALLLAGLLRRLLHSAATAFAIALLWAVHPLNSEAVVYIVQRTELLVSFWLLATLYAAARHRGAAGNARIAWHAAAATACVLGMATKEVMVGAPILVLLHDRVASGDSIGRCLRRRPGLYGVLAASWIVLLGLVWHNPRSASAGLGLEVSPWQYLLTQAEVLVHYLRLAVWPWPLSIAYHWDVANSPLDVWPQGLLVLALLAVTAWGLWRNTLVGFAGAWFFVLLAPTSSVVPIVTEIAAERRMYLPLVAVIGVVVFAIGRVAPPARAAATTLAIVAALSASAAAVALARLEHWASEDRIWAEAARVQPWSATAASQHGTRLAGAGDVEQGLRVIDAALQAQPEHALLLTNRGALLAQLDRPAEAADAFIAAIRSDPTLIEAYLNYAALLANHDRLRDAAVLLRQALARSPGHPAATAMLQQVEADLMNRGGSEP